MKKNTKCTAFNGSLIGIKHTYLFIGCAFLLFTFPVNLFAQVGHRSTEEMLQLRLKKSFNKTAIITKKNNAAGLSTLTTPFTVTQADAVTNPLSQIIQSLVGPGVTVSNIQTTLPATSNIYGSFSGGTNVIGMESGLIMTSGSVFNALGPNISAFTSQDNGLPGYLPSDTAGFDAAVISFDVKSTTSFLSFKYVFASEEYNEYVGSPFNDEFAFFISGPGIPSGTNIALIPGTNTPVAINNVNLNLNSQYYINNDSAGFVDPVKFQNLEYDGLTKVLVTSAITVVPGATYKITLVIQDFEDAIYDSGVFIEGGSITSDSCVLSAFATKKDISCHGANNGSIDMTFNGANGTPKFKWSNGATTEDLINLQPGSYNVTITDEKGCTATLSSPVVINEPSAITLGNPVITSASCGVGNGGVQVTANGGTPPYQYTVGITTNTSGIFTNLAGGTYNYSVADSNDCTTTGSFIIPEGSSISASATKKDISCHGANDGSIDLTVSGAGGTTKFKWSNGETTEDPINLQPGSYNVTITDEKGCTATLSAPVVINEPSALTLGKPVITSASCGVGNGGAQVTANGSTPPYQYTVGNTTNASGIFTGLAASTYNYSVADSNNCTITGSFNIPEGSSVSASATKKDISCHGANDGSIDLTVSGASGTAEFKWSNGETTEDLANLQPGSYNVTITDEQGCTATLSAPVVINEPSAITLGKPIITSASCGDGNGGAQVTANGGTPPYQYTVGNTTNTSGIFTNLPGGTYNYSVVDGNSCSSSGSFVIPQGAKIICSITAIPDFHIAGQVENTIFLGYGPQSIKLVGKVSGGTGPYNYNWNGAGSTSSINVSPVTTTTYVLTVTDQNGCQSTCNITINVVDVRCGNKLDKVQICHKNNGKSEGKTLYVSADAIAGHLAHGDYLGSCKTSTKVSFENGTTLARNGEDVQALDIQSLRVKALPNPTSLYFKLQIETNNAKEKISLRILDLNGRQIELRNNLNSGQIIQIGNSYRPGIYIAELVQGKQRIALKLVKYPD